MRGGGGGGGVIICEEICWVHWRLRSHVFEDFLVLDTGTGVIRLFNVHFMRSL